MSEIVKQQQSRLKDLIARGKEQGYLTYAEVNDHLPEDLADEEQVKNIVQMINDMGIRVFENVPDAEALLMADGEAAIDEAAAAEAAAALAAAASSFLSATRLSVVRTIAATEAAFSRAERVTFVGSTIPASIISV